MHEKVLMNGRIYTFLEQLPSLEQADAFILCANDQGEKYVCSEQFWNDHALPAIPAAPVCSKSSAQEKINFFLSMFKGRENLYARRYHSTKSGKSGYTPVCKHEWESEVCDKKKYRCPDCPNREFLPLTAEVMKAHLMGRDPLCRDVAAIYPMLEDNTTWLMAADAERKKLQAQIESKLATIARLGRAFGIHLILATQRPDATIIPGQIKNNLDFRVCGRAECVLSAIILDNGSAAEQIPKDARGRFITGDGTVFQGFLFDDRQL